MELPWKRRGKITREEIQRVEQPTEERSPISEELRLLTRAELEQRYEQYAQEAHSKEKDLLKIFVWPTKKAEMRNRLDYIYARLEDIRSLLRTPQEKKNPAEQPWTPEQQSMKAAQNILQTDREHAHQAIATNDESFFTQNPSQSSIQDQLTSFSPDVLLPLQQQLGKEIGGRIGEIDLLNHTVVSSNAETPKTKEEIDREIVKHPERFGLQAFRSNEMRAAYQELRDTKKVYQHEIDF
ncbi:MAG TPA: hypothetical protein VJB65_04870, partial [Patescibacteria group bacterium]|nr:hypothetical protein [Patescibacteria group bacterium]